ncbi:hypothetical protein D9M70_640370 [compost metagenome]
MDTNGVVPALPTSALLPTTKAPSSCRAVPVLWLLPLWALTTMPLSLPTPACITGASLRPSMVMVAVLTVTPPWLSRTL